MTLVTINNEAKCDCPCRRRFLILSGAGAAALGLAATGCDPYELDRLLEDVDIELAAHPELEIIGETAMIELEQLSLPLAVTRTGPDEADFIVTGTECSRRGCGVGRSGDGSTARCAKARRPRV